MIWTRLARRQAGVIARRQLLACDLSARVVDGMLARGRLERTTATAVYRVGGAPDTAASACWRAVLATRAPLSFVTAAQWWQMPVPDDGRLHITRLDRRRLDWPDGVRIHRVALRHAALTEQHGMPLTTRTETALDCMGSLHLRDARSFADRAVAQAWVTTADIERRLADEPGRWGNRQLKRLLTQTSDGAAAESERILHRILRRGGLRGWVANLDVIAYGQRFVLDVGFPQSMIAIEVDGYAYHSSVESFQRDRRRQNALIASGWTVLRFTWNDLESRPQWVLATIRTVLAANLRIGG